MRGEEGDGSSRDWRLPAVGSGAQVTSTSPESHEGGCYNLRVCYIFRVASTKILLIQLMFINHSLIVSVPIYILFSF